MSEIRWVEATPVLGATAPGGVYGPMAREAYGGAPVMRTLLEPTPPPPPPPKPIEPALVAESRSLASRIAEMVRQLDVTLRRLDAPVPAEMPAAAVAPPPPPPAPPPPTPDPVVGTPDPPAPKSRRKWTGRVRLWAV
jgi:hypothetical protein